MNCFNWKNFCYGAIGCSIILVAVMASFHWIVGGDISPKHFTYQHYLKMDSIQLKALTDTLYLHQIMAQADSVSNTTAEISNRYQDDVNLMIYKSTQWFTIWIGIMAIVAGGMAINQFYNHRKAAADKKELEDKFEEFKKNITDKVKENIDRYEKNADLHVKSVVDAKMGEITVMRNDIEKLNETLKNTHRDIKISSLVTCISTFPDPSMFTSKPEKKEYLRYYLNNLHKELSDFIAQFAQIEPSLNDKNRLAVVLTSVKYVIVRSRSIYPGYHQNITYNQLCKAIDKPLKTIVNGTVKNKDLFEDLTAVVEVFGKMIRDISIDGAAV